MNCPAVTGGGEVKNPQNYVGFRLLGECQIRSRVRSKRERLASKFNEGFTVKHRLVLPLVDRACGKHNSM